MDPFPDRYGPNTVELAGRTTGQLNGIRAIPVRKWVHTYDLLRRTGWKKTNSVHRPGVSGKPNTCHSHVDNY